MKKKLILVLLILAFSFNIDAQCTFNGTATALESRCRESGTITINMLPAAAYSYQITTGPITSALTSSNIFNGLPAGNYTITISLGGCSTTINSYVPGAYTEPGLLSATVKNIACPSGTGCITANEPTGGNNPYTYSIIAGPVTKPFQSQRDFCGLPSGAYTLQALDSCGVVRTTNYTVAYDTGTFVAYTYGYDLRHANCTDLVVCPLTGFSNTSSHSLMKVWYVKPNGDTLKVNQLESPVLCDTLVAESHTYGTWKMLGYDSCGRVVESTFSHTAPVFYLNYAGNNCNGNDVQFFNNWKYGIPITYVVKKCSDNSIVYNISQIPPTTFYSPTFSLIADTCYKFESYNNCGDTVKGNYTAPPKPVFNINACQGTGCSENGKGSISISEDYGTGTKPINFTIISGPDGVGMSASQTQFLSYVYLRDLVLGTYKVAAIDACGKKDTIEITLNKPLQRIVEITKTISCSGGALVHVKISTNFNTCNYAATSVGNNIYVTATNPGYNPSNVTNVAPTATTLGVWEADYFNVLPGNVLFRLYSNNDGCNWDTTINILTYAAPVLSSVAGYVCGASSIGTVNYTIAGGKPPYQYRVRQLGSTIWSAWQSNTVFSGINAGSYEINVQDACPNGSISFVSFNPWVKSGISTSSSCPSIGGTYSLTANPFVNGVNYEWLYNGNVIGTGATYNFSNFGLANNGTYKLRQVFPGSTCIDTAAVNILDCVTLPISFDKLYGVNKNNENTLTWKTFGNDADVKFHIEHSVDGVFFTTIETILGKNNSNGSDYKYTHSYISATNFYRIKIVSTQGNFQFSNIVKIEKKNTKNYEVNVNPNPFSAYLNIQIISDKKEKYYFVLYDIYGKTVLKRNIILQVGITNILLEKELALLASGVYFLETINSKNELIRKKVIKL